jgi:hypothetical protein
MSIVQKLTEGIVNRDLSAEGAALINKWENTGLLEGLQNDAARQGMSRLLENQAKELLRESSTMAGGDVEGFAAVAFPLVRRVFGSLIANDLVSVQPMSLPSGLIFFLDFTVGNTIGDGLAAPNPRLGYPTASSLYGGGKVGAEITGGISLTGVNAERGPYALNNGYSSPTGSASTNFQDAAATDTGGATFHVGGLVGAGNTVIDRIVNFDPDLSGTICAAYLLPRNALSGTLSTSNFNFDDLVAITVDTSSAGSAGNSTGMSGSQIRRATAFSGSNRANAVFLVFQADTGVSLLTLTSSINGGDAGGKQPVVCPWTVRFPIVDRFAGGTPAGSVLAGDVWGLEGNDQIPEIDIKVDSVAVTAITKKLKAKWTPELGQDLNAYHNLDAEVELTQILSEQVALEIDREIVEDLVRGATAGVRYWSRNPGQFLNRLNGEDDSNGTNPPDFTGNVSEWYETLIETINDVSAQIHRKTLRGAANFVVVGPEVANILEFTAGFRANVTADSDRGEAGAVKVGSLSKKFDVIVDPYFPRQLVLVGRRGSSFLESGYVYAPYVPLQTTPTIFGVEDFVPRKGVMTRYAKKMVRPDMYGLVVVRALEGEL